ncbi:alpha/beta hydrolase fold-domain-containing protein [Lentinula aciculospora]|uniref:Alpha/beta hydrolase fold-domain-containing protein n=1 Tax=Lentinula aciculospora TaxID=153920 RepID=A0A9W9DR43_9AGAR|nr:alpha/beta hydrolase fold-domain-containing protein [Lentinula aciculospora]
MSSVEPQSIAKQPLHHSIISRLDLEYITFHEKYLQHLTPPHTLPWDSAKMRVPPTYGAGSKTPLDVGNITEYELKKGGHGRKMRAYTPFGQPPKTGWPVILFFHGGGWALGGLDSEQSVITNLCVGAKCVVLSVDYRLAPENKFPAAVEDAVEALRWVLTDGKMLLNIDTSKIATGGLSAGGNLAAVLALKSTEDFFTPTLPVPLALQLLIVPCLDLTATDAPGGRWESNKHAPFLPPARMNWFKKMYIQNEEDCSKWEVSPLLAPEELMRKAPKAWIAAGELDVLCNEAQAYTEKLNQCGVQAECVVYKGGTHLNFVLDGECYVSPRVQSTIDVITMITPICRVSNIAL